MTRAVVTAYAAVAPGCELTHAGWTCDATTPAARSIGRFGAAGFPVPSAAELPVADEAELLAKVMRLALGSWSGDGGFPVCAHHRPEEIGVFVGAEPLRMSIGTQCDAKRDRSPERLTDALALALGARGPSRTFSMACVASSTAVGAAARAIRAGEVTLAVAAGVAINVEPLLFAGFCHLGAMSARGVCRPFDASRDGFVLADAAGLVVLESEARVRESRRSDRIRATILGVGEAMDAYRMTDPHPEGLGARQAIANALNDAGVAPSDVALVKAHATGTPKNDEVEARVIHDLFGTRPAVLALKGRLGHSIAASGVVETAHAIDALTRRVAPGVGTLTVFDDALPPIRVSNDPVAIDGAVAVLNTFGFGGLNAALVVSV